MADIATALESRYGRVTSDLATGEVARITVEVWSDEASFLAEMERFFGRRYNANGYVTGPTVLRVLAVPSVARNATHEMSHAISLSVNPTFGNRPRWLWESVALFENDEFVDPRSISYLAQGRFPTLGATPTPTRAGSLGGRIPDWRARVARADATDCAPPCDGSGVRESCGLGPNGHRPCALRGRRVIDTRRGRPSTYPCPAGRLAQR